MQKSLESSDEALQLNISSGSSNDITHLSFKRKGSEESYSETLKGDASDFENSPTSSCKKIKQEEGSDKFCSNTKNLSYLVWGAHNTTMSMEERRKYLEEPPEWPESIRKIIRYENDPTPPSK